MGSLGLPVKKMKILATVAIAARAGMPDFDDAIAIEEIADNNTVFDEGRDAMLQAINHAIRADSAASEERSELFDGSGDDDGEFVSTLERAKRNQKVGVCGQSKVHSELLSEMIDYSFERKENKKAEEPEDYKKYVYTGRTKAEDGEFPFLFSLRSNE